LSFGAFGQALDYSLVPGHRLEADIHLYPGGLGMRGLVGEVHEALVPTRRAPGASSVADAMAARGRALAFEPWLERWPACVLASPTIAGRSWVLTDAGGSVPLVDDSVLPALLAASEGRPVAVTGELVAGGFLPLALHHDGLTVSL
jgi:hypothetical protein